MGNCIAGSCSCFDWCPKCCHRSYYRCSTCCGNICYKNCGCSCNNDTVLPLACVNKTKRYTTDIPPLLLFAASWAIILTILAAAYEFKADPHRLTRGVDYMDRICGYSPGVEDKPYAAWPLIDVKAEGSSESTTYDIKVCVSDCAETSVLSNNSQFVEPYTTSSLYYYCLPAVNESRTSIDFHSRDLNNASAVLTRLVSDIWTSWQVLLGSFFLAALLSFLYIILCRKFATLLVWTTVSMVIIGAFTLSYGLLTFSESEFLLSHDERLRLASQILAYVCAGASFLVLVFIIFTRKRIQLAVEVVRETSRALGDMSSIFGLPLVFLALGALYFAFWAYVALYIFSVSEPTEFPMPVELVEVLGSTTYIERVWDRNMRNTLIFHFFHLLWSVQFIIYVAYTILAGALADWYFTYVDEKGQKQHGVRDDELPDHVILSSVGRTLRYNLGTVALGSLLIAVVQMVRWWVRYLEGTCKDQKNVFQKGLFILVERLLKCLECCLDKVNKNAFIYCAIYGEAFCTSACSAFQLIWMNLARVVALTIISDFLVFIGKVAVSLFVTGVAGQAIQVLYANEVSSLIFPLAFVFALSYMVSSIFMVMYEACIDTVFFCFLVDEEVNKGGKMFASSTLINIVDKHAASSKALAKTHTNWEETSNALRTRTNAMRTKSQEEKARN